MDAQLLDWLLEEDNPGVRLRALTGLCRLPDTDPQVLSSRALVCQTLDAAHDLAWTERKGLALRYGLTALAESGVTRDAVAVDALVGRLFSELQDVNCGDFIFLRALVMLGYGDSQRFGQALRRACEKQLPDGGWLCLHRLSKMSRIPKSCIKANMHALLLAGEMKKRGMPFPGSDSLVEYFLKRRLFYRMDKPDRLVLACRPGYRMIDAYFPIEIQRVGLPLLLEALAALGFGQADELVEAWQLLEAKRDDKGRIRLEGTLAKSYLPRERVGRPSKWATLYACMAWNERRESAADPAGQRAREAGMAQQAHAGDGKTRAK